MYWSSCYASPDLVKVKLLHYIDKITSRTKAPSRRKHMVSENILRLQPDLAFSLPNWLIIFFRKISLVTEYLIMMFAPVLKF